MKVKKRILAGAYALIKAPTILKERHRTLISLI